MAISETDIAHAVNSGIIEADILAHLMKTNSVSIKLIDASYPADPSLPGIYNAVTFDIDDIADPLSPMAHMLPSADVFAEKVSALGITNDDFVVAYDRSGFIMAASRAWWMFRVFGHDRVAVLNGGLENWVQKRFPVTEKQSLPATAQFSACLRPELVVDYDQVKAISQTGSHTILDARPPERFVRHIQGSKNISALGLIAHDRTLKSDIEFRAELASNHIDIDSPLIASCGSGVTACAVALALFREGKKDVPVYDGSWTEWSSR